MPRPSFSRKIIKRKKKKKQKKKNNNKILEFLLLQILFAALRLKVSDIAKHKNGVQTNMFYYFSMKRVVDSHKKVLAKRLLMGTTMYAPQN